MADINLLTRNVECVPCIHPVDFNDGATTGDYICMKNYDAALVCLYMKAMGAATTVTIQQCTQDADAGGDVKAIGAGKTITGVANSIVSTNVRASELDADNNFDWLKITCNDPGAAAVGCVFVAGYRGRWSEATMPALV